ncbi:MAG TPA: selenocysteine-specific translation elongation factor [Terracidiphilus sp.]|jgi:selenocysteine-specific elongation factor
MKPTKSIVIGTAGHIDHGKTALVRALTGVDTDRLPEEKRRGITIDLGFAAMDVSGADGSLLRISFVDVPGHALFIRNMLAGAGCVPAVMLVIAADEGVMPQTREHLAICELLGISDGFTVISKSELVKESQLAEIRNQIAAFLKDTFLDPGAHAIVAASAHTGSELAAVRAELTRLAVRARDAEFARTMRLPIDRTFVKKGFGTVVTGTLLSGEMRVGETLALEPGARKVRVRGLQTHGESEETAEAGTRVAVNLAGVETGQISRGQTLVVPGELSAVEVFDAEIRLLEGASPLKHRARVHLHAFTSETMAAVSLYGNEAVKAGTTRLARLKLSSPMVLAPGDRFVLRQPLPAGTIGGGRVLDTHPLAHERRAAAQAWLDSLAHASLSQSLILRVRRNGSAGVRMSALVSEMGIHLAAVRALAEDAQSAGELLRLGELLVAREGFQEVVQQVLARLKDAAPGLKRSELQSQTESPAEVLEAAIEKLVDERKIQLRGEMASLAGAVAGFDNRESKMAHAVIATYQTAGLAPSSVREVGLRLGLAESEMRRVVTLLIREKVLIRMGDDETFVHAGAVKKLASRLAVQRGKMLDVASFKAMTGLTRKHAIPLLELLDRERITRKQGDVRVVL